MIKNMEALTKHIYIPRHINQQTPTTTRSPMGMSWVEMRSMKKRRPPVGWRGQPYRHSLARRGILTARGRPFSQIKDQDDFQDYLEDEGTDISRRRISDARFQLSRDRRDLKRLKEIDIRILDALEKGELDLAEILIDAQNSDNQLRAGGVLQKIREKILPPKITASSAPQERLTAYSIWYQKELDKRNRKLAKAPSESAMEEVDWDFNALIYQKRETLGLSPEDVEEIEAEARIYMSFYQPSERTITQRERAAIHPVDMRRTSASLPPRVSETFNEMTVDTDYSEGEYSVLDQEASRRDMSIDAMGSSSLAVQEDVRGVLSKDRSKIEREYLEELQQNRNLRSAIGNEMENEWRLREDELAFREDMINNTERALVAGGIGIPAGLLESLASGIGSAMVSNLGAAPSQPAPSAPPSNTSPSVTPPPVTPPAPTEYLLVKKSDIVGTVTQPKGGT